MNTLPDFARRELIEGLQKLMLLRLQGAPPEDMIEGVALMWIETLAYKRSWLEAQDAGRIKQAFLSLAQSLKQWPTPSMLIECLPPRRPNAKPLLNHHRQLSEEEKAANRQRLRQILTQLQQKKG